MHRRRYRPAIDCCRDLDAYRQSNPDLFPPAAPSGDLSRGHIRFAAEAMLAIINGEAIEEENAMRALSIAEILARA